MLNRQCNRSRPMGQISIGAQPRGVPPRARVRLRVEDESVLPLSMTIAIEQVNLAATGRAGSGWDLLRTRNFSLLFSAAKRCPRLATA